MTVAAAQTPDTDVVPEATDTDIVPEATAFYDVTSPA